MDKPEQKIRSKTVLQSFTQTDENGHNLSLRYELTRSVEAQPTATKQLRLEINRPESPMWPRLRLATEFSGADAMQFLAAELKIRTLLGMREHMHEQTPRNGVEFSLDISSNLKIGAIETKGTEPSFFAEFSTDSGRIRFEFATMDDWDKFKEVFQHAC